MATRVGFGGVGQTARPDGNVHYDVDETGHRVAALPATCKRGKHSLHEVGYCATEQDGELRVSCNACSSEPHPDHMWWLTTTPPRPDRAELDDRPYRDITPHFIARPQSGSTPTPTP